MTTTRHPDKESVPELPGRFIPFARVVHSKYLIVDEKILWVGTANWEPGMFLGCRNIELVIRRPAFAEQVLTFYDLRLDLVAHRVFRGEREIHLSPTEFRLLRHFLENPSRVFSRAQLLDRVWGSDLEIELRTVDATIRRLRRALNAGGEADLLRTVRAEGYSLDHKIAIAAGQMDQAAVGS